MNATLHTPPPRAAEGPRALRGWLPRLAAACRALALVPPTSVLLASGAHAQSSGCEQFRDKLAARVDPSIRGFTLDIVPASTPMPPGAKVFGTCDGGAFKILFRRGGNTRPVPSGEAAESPASAVQAKAPEPAPKPPAVQADRTPPPAVAAPAPSPAVPPRPAPVTPPPSAPAPTREPDKPVAALAREAEPAPDRPAPPTAPAEPTPAAAESTPKVAQASGFMAGAWRWAWLLLLLPIGGGLWAWYAHHSAYDEAGLPRGPKL